MPALVPLPNYRPGHISGYVPKETPFIDKLLASILMSAASSATNQFIDDLITTKSEKTQNAYMEKLMENQDMQRQLQELNLSEAKGKRDQELSFYINSLIEGLSGREGLGTGSDELYKYAWDKAQNMEDGSIYGPDYRKELQEWANNYLSSQGQGDGASERNKDSDIWDIIGNLFSSRKDSDTMPTRTGAPGQEPLADDRPIPTEIEALQEAPDNFDSDATRLSPLEAYITAAVTQGNNAEKVERPPITNEAIGLTPLEKIIESLAKSGYRK